MEEHVICETLQKCEIIKKIFKRNEKCYKGNHYELCFECELSINEEETRLIVVCIPQKWHQDLVDIYFALYDGKFIPHVESDGKICLFEKEGILIDHNLEGILVQSIFRAKDIILDGILDKNIDDFIDEFELYWKQLPECRTAKFVVPDIENNQIVKSSFRKIVQQKKERQSAYFRRQHLTTIYIGKDMEALKQWNLQNSTLINAAYFVISPTENIYPPDIRKPVSIEYFNKLLRMVPSGDVANIWHKLSRNRIFIFELRQPRGNKNFIGFYLVGGILVAESNYLKITNVEKIQPVMIYRTDKKYLMMRTSDMSLLQRKKRILIVGCGSIGGYVISELAKSGFEDLTIVDNDILTEENIFRHILGMEYIAKYKCVALEEYIQKNIPKVLIKSLADRIEDAIEDESITFNEYDIIISATGNHNINRWINSYMMKNKVDSPIIYAWNEIYGIGNHVAYFKYGNKGCYECLFARDEETNEIYDKSSYCAKGQKVVSNIGCGKSFVPYGNLISQKTMLILMDVLSEVISGKIKDNTLISMKGDNSYFTEMKLKSSERYKRQDENIKRLVGNQFWNKQCGECGDNN